MADTSNTADIIDSRDIIARIEELSEQEERDADETAELAALRKVAKQAEPCAPDWVYGESLVRDSYFETYAREYVEECHEVPTRWPFSCIDWEQVAREFQVNYTAVDYDGVTYWVR